MILYQLYAFVLPAFSPRERRVALPLLLMVPLLFVGGVVFGYFVVLDRGRRLPLNFNNDQFNIQVRARDYYSFVTLTLLALGLVFQIPMGILARHAPGDHHPEQLRRIAPLRLSSAIAVLAALLPTIDPVTMLIEMVPLVVLYELSIVLARLLGRPPDEPAPASRAPEGSG